MKLQRHALGLGRPLEGLRRPYYRVNKLTSWSGGSLTKVQRISALAGVVHGPEAPYGIK